MLSSFYHLYTYSLFHIPPISPSTHSPFIIPYPLFIIYSSFKYSLILPLLFTYLSFIPLFLSSPTLLLISLSIISHPPPLHRPLSHSPFIHYSFPRSPRGEGKPRRDPHAPAHTTDFSPLIFAPFFPSLMTWPAFLPRGEAYARPPWFRSVVFSLGLRRGFFFLDIGPGWCLKGEDAARKVRHTEVLFFVGLLFCFFVFFSFGGFFWGFLFVVCCVLGFLFIGGFGLFLGVFVLEGNLGDFFYFWFILVNIFQGFMERGFFFINDL